MDAQARVARWLAIAARAVELDPATSGEAGASAGARVPLRRFASALAAVRVAPSVTDPSSRGVPHHVAIFGGTNSGKSTVASLLLGVDSGAMAVRARYTQHPTAYHAGDAAWISRPSWPLSAYRVHRDDPPHYSDEDIARGRYVPGIHLRRRDALPRIDVSAAHAEPGPVLPDDVVLWDLPDFSTDAAAAYLDSVLDIIALADLVLLTLTEESYADARVDDLLGLVGRSGVETRVIANKVSGDPDLLEHIEGRIGEIHDRGRVFALPRVDGSSASARLAELIGTEDARALQADVHAALADRGQLRRHAIEGALRLWERDVDTILSPLVEAADADLAWRRFVREQTESIILSGYRRDYLETSDYGEFNETVVRVLDLLEVPGVGPVLRQVANIARVPMRLVLDTLRGAFNQIVPRDRAKTRTLEHQILAVLTAEWLDALRREAQRLAQDTREAQWADIARTLGDRSALDLIESRFVEAYGRYAELRGREVRERAREIVAILEDHPALCRTLRSVRLGTDLAAITAAVASGGLSWTDALWGPLVAAVMQEVFEAGLGVYIDGQKRRLKRRQFDLVERLVLEAMEAPVLALAPSTTTHDDLAAVRSDVAAVSELLGRHAWGT